MAKKKRASKHASGPNPAELSFEEAIEELNDIIDQIEQGEIGLEEALRRRTRGDALIKRCRAILDVAEQELQQAEPGESADKSR